MSYLEKSRGIEESYTNRKLTLDQYKSIYVEKTNDNDDIRLRQSYNRYKSRTVIKPTNNITITSNIPRDVSNIILNKTTKVKPYNRSSYYDKNRLPEVEKKCDRPITLRELKDLHTNVNNDKEIKKLFLDNSLVIAPVKGWEGIRVFELNSSNNIVSDTELGKQSLNGPTYSYTLLTKEVVEEESLGIFIRKNDTFRYSGSIVTLPFYRYFLEKRTLCYNLVDEEYVNSQLIKMVRSNINNLLGEVNKIFNVNYDSLLNLDYNRYYITAEIVQDALDEYTEDANKELDVFGFLSQIMNSLSSLVLFFYTIGIFNTEESEDDKIGIITDVNGMSGDFEELLNLINLHFYSIIFGLRTAVDMGLYETHKVDNGLVNISELKEGFYEYLEERNNYYNKRI